MNENELMTFIASYAIVIVVGYFLPTFLAMFRGHRRKIGIFIVNIFVGWTGVGWIILLAYAVLSQAKDTNS